jgi:tetratricopeptide (TPR) repeat protein
MKSLVRRALALLLALAGLLPFAAGAALPNTSDSWVALAARSMQASRVTADPAEYARAAAALDRALALDPAHYGALRMRAWVLLSQHDFQGALAAARRAEALAPGDWWNYANLTDAYVELGEYDEAVAAADHLAALRPGLAAYTRVAFLRTLHGDRAGAIEALERAVAAASPLEPEGLAWALVHLGHEHFGRGDLADAGAAYGRALAALPGYYLALGGLGRVRAAEGRFDDAIALYEDAQARVPSPDVVAALADVHAAAGNTTAAAAQLALLDHIARLGEATGVAHGRQLAMAWADHDRRLADALRLVEREATTRGGIYADDALAWTLHKNGRHRAAARAAHRALRLGTPDATLHYHAGMIAAALGRDRVAARHLRRALALNPYFDIGQVPRAAATLAALEARPARLVAASPGRAG